MGWAFGSQAPAGATPPTVLSRRISTVLANWPLGAHGATGELRRVQVGVEVPRVAADLPDEVTVHVLHHAGDPGDRGGQPVRGGEERYRDRAVHADGTGVDVSVGRRADARPAERVADPVAVRTDEQGRVPVRVADRLGTRYLLIAAQQAGERAAA